ncbi:MAG: flagellar filament capping protein FliD [Geothrix sp.]|uniref:flagellar filament capping protein FliD n=1 Tax=Geothrix sp. TaxID=1962974 RepID=UPI00180C90A9|nr:flagellar filament capping protein FliD [Geothrix sp.]NWJ41145.1 flagellar filament capping protein FliD [Geothrix sp.]WIL20866.1 MAG: flagellar filament capping protein FliD [Geothrix sp.]
MATSSLTSISGITTGIDTKALVDAIVAQKATGMNRLQAKKDLNDKKTAALTAMRTALTTLSLSMASLQDKLNSRTVTSTDTNNTNVTATATGIASGNYDISVKTVATKGRLSAALDPVTGYTLSVANPGDSTLSPIFTSGTSATFAVQGTDGVVKEITLDASSNSLNGLRDKINASGAGVTATVVNVGKGSSPYQLVLTAKDTGTGKTGGVVTLATLSGTVAASLGIASGSYGAPLADGTQTIVGGVTSATSGANATDADFTLNGIELTRTTNVVKDAVDGMTFTLKQGNQAGTTTLSVAPDKAGATAAVQDFITKYNQLMKDYHDASTSTKNADGSINQAPLASDSATRAMMGNLKATLFGQTAGLPGGATYKTLPNIGISTQADGTVYLNTITFQTAMTNDLASVQRLFTFAGDSTSPAVTVRAGGSKTVTGPIDFAITKDAGTGVLWGTLTRNGVTSDPIQVTDGVLSGTGDFAGLSLAVGGAGSGTITLSRGVGQAAKDLITNFTTPGSAGGISSILDSIQAQNKSLGSQIQDAQTRLNHERDNLTKKFAQMESVVAQMRAGASSLGSA